MYKLLSVISLVSIYILTGCAAKQPDYDPAIVPAKSASQPVVTENTKPPVTLAVPAAADPSKTAPVIKTTASTPATNTAPGMNPAHGQPGHRCDIAVGAPLNSKPNPTAQTVTTTPVKMETTPVKNDVTPVKNTSGARLNPAHGQPGHDCSIAVGQPLKS